MESGSGFRKDVLLMRKRIVRKIGIFVGFVGFSEQPFFIPPDEKIIQKAYEGFRVPKKRGRDSGGRTCGGPLPSGPSGIRPSHSSAKESAAACRGPEGSAPSASAHCGDQRGDDRHTTESHSRNHVRGILDPLTHPDGHTSTSQPTSPSVYNNSRSPSWLARPVYLTLCLDAA